MEEPKMEFTLPKALNDFVFDFYEATRRSMRLDDVVQIYEVGFKELTDRYFSQSAWPEPKLIAAECNFDEEFLTFYKELITRHLFTPKLKPSTTDLIESFETYKKLFGIILSSNQPTIALTVQWVNDILQEFVYQFQGFSQFRTQIKYRTAEELRILEENRDAWNLPTVLKILNDLVKFGALNSKHALLAQFGYFASVELGRLECLLGDFSSSLQAISPATLGSRAELLTQTPTCYVNVYYHAGVSQLMLRRFVDAIETFSEISLYIHGILKPGAALLRQGSQSTLQRILDKILGLLAISIALCPGYRADDQVRELVDVKFAEKLRRMNSGDAACLSDTFEQSCPKFICPYVPDYSVPHNHNQDAFGHQVAIFTEEAKQQMSVLKLRSYLRLYASIELSKLARISDSSEDAFLSQLLSYKHKTLQIQTRDSSGSDVSDSKTSTSDVNYQVQDRTVIIETASAKSSKNAAAERYYVGGVRKHAEIISEINRTFGRIGL